MRSGRLLAVLLLSATAACLGAMPRPRTNSLQRLSYAGRARTYLIHLPPSYRADQPMPLVLVLHGGGGNAVSAARQTGFSAEADRRGFIVVYPNGTGRFARHLLTWNACGCCGYAMDHGVDDVGFIRTLLDNLERDYRIDRRRVYATGLSNGAMMAYRLACEMPERLAAVASVAGAMDCPSCHPLLPVSVLEIHGTADANVPYNGGRPRKQFDYHPRVDRSAPGTARFWARADGCAARPGRENHGGVRVATWSGGRDGTEVQLYTIVGGGHSWPGGRRMARFLDPPFAGLDATGVIWRFFSRHRRP